MRHIFSIVCIGLIIWLASDKIAATYPRENWVAVLKNPTKCNTREEMDRVVALMMQRENGTASSFWSSCQELPSGTEVFVELVPYFNLCIRASDEVSCMWSDEGWKISARQHLPLVLPSLHFDGRVIAHFRDRAY